MLWLVLYFGNQTESNIWIDTGTEMKNWNECAEGKCRENHKNCINTIGSYECNCSEGYKINSTGDCVTLCSDVNCGHGVCKQSGNNGFWCQCDYGCSDENCIKRANNE